MKNLMKNLFLSLSAVLISSQFETVCNFFLRSAKELYDRYSDCASEEKIVKWPNNIKGAASFAGRQFDMLQGN